MTQYYLEIWVTVRQWLDIFKKFDSDVSGKFDAFELRQALAYASIHLSRDITGVLVIRYAETDSDNRNCGLTISTVRIRFKIILTLFCQLLLNNSCGNIEKFLSIFI